MDQSFVVVEGLVENFSIIGVEQSFFFGQKIEKFAKRKSAAREIDGIKFGLDRKWKTFCCP